MGWRYEEQGFDLDGTPYLPGFWLPDWSSWIEIKGPQPTAEENDKCWLDLEVSEKLLVSGDLAHRGQRQEHLDGVACQVAA